MAHFLGIHHARKALPLQSVCLQPERFAVLDVVLNTVYGIATIAQEAFYVMQLDQSADCHLQL